MPTFKSIYNLSPLKCSENTHATIKQYIAVLCCCLVMSDSFAAPWTLACQAPLSTGFSRQEHWSGLPFPSPGKCVLTAFIKSKKY